MNKIERLVIVLVVLYALSLLATMTSKVGSVFFPDTDFFLALKIQTKLFLAASYFFNMIVFVGSAVWLFLEARKHDSYPWMWGFLGLFSGVFGLVLWFLFIIYNELVALKEEAKGKSQRGQVESAGKSRQRVRGESPPHGKG